MKKREQERRGRPGPDRKKPVIRQFPGYIVQQYGTRFSPERRSKADTLAHYQDQGRVAELEAALARLIGVVSGTPAQNTPAFFAAKTLLNAAAMKEGK